VRTALLLLACVACAGTPEEEPEESGPPPLPVELAGNEGVSARDLEFAARRELRSFQEKGRRAADLADAAYAMELALRREGYAHASVSFRMEHSEEAPERVVFEIAEGPRTRIASLSFPGQSAFPGDLARFFPGGEDAVFRQADVDGGAAEIERAYLLAGYRDVEVAPPRVEWNADRTAAAVTIPITEGEQHLVVEAVFEGEVPPDLRAEIEKGLLGKPYYARLPAEAAARLRAHFFDRGHQQAEAEAKAELDGTRVTIRLRAEPGPQYRLREFRIEGTERTRKRFVRTRIPLKKGDVLAQDQIDRGVDHLYDSGIFRTVRVRPDGLTPEEAEADLLVQLEELEARSIAFDAGWGSYEQARGGVRYQDRNFLGFARRLDLGAHASTKGYRVDGSISDNYLLGRRNTLRLGGQLFQREEPSFTRFGYTFDLTLTHEMKGPYVVTVGYTLDTQEATDIKSDFDEDEGEFVTSAGFLASLVRDTRNNKLLPRTGSISEIGVFWSTDAFGADLNYLEVRGNWFGFFPVSERVVVGTGVRFQSRPILDDLETLPIQKRLFLGGATTVRSFRQSRLGPFDASNREPTGGLTAASAHVEVRARVWQELHVATFYELGMVSERSLSIDGPPGQAVGAGLRYYLPVGPIRIDAAYNPGELFGMTTRWAFHFAFGFSF